MKHNTEHKRPVYNIFYVCNAWTIWYIHIATQIQILYKALMLYVQLL